MDGASGSAPPAAPAEDGAPAADPRQAADGYSDEPKPLAEYDAKFGQGFMKTDMVVGMIYQALK